MEALSSTCQWLIHLSDLHLRWEAGKAAPYLEQIKAIEQGLRHWSQSDPNRKRTPVCAVAITGDIFDTGTLEGGAVRDVLVALVRAIRAALGPCGPILLVPGNHDLRIVGLINGRSHVLEELRRDLAPTSDAEPLIEVPGLAEVYLGHIDDPVVAQAFEPLPFPTVLYDSSFLDGGLFGAGGTVSAADIFSLVPQLKRLGRPHAPLLLLMHHHLIPTPVTDVSHAGVGYFDKGFTGKVTGAGMWIAKELISNADREETTMTALGAGSMLSALHSLGRPVLVLHGHKHYPTARVLRATRSNDGEVALVAAGSAGLSEKIQTTHTTVPIWPNFNALSIRGDEENGFDVEVETVHFSPTPATDPNIHVRPLVRLHSKASRWHPEDLVEASVQAVLESNCATYTVLNSDSEALDLRLQRSFSLVEGQALDGPDGDKKALIEELTEPPSAKLVGPGFSDEFPAVLSIPLDRGEVDVKLERAFATSRSAACELYGERTNYEWVALPIRYGTRRASLTLLCSRPELLAHPFATVTDLATGREWPVDVETITGGLRVSTGPCAARTLVRLYVRLPK